MATQHDVLKMVRDEYSYNGLVQRGLISCLRHTGGMKRLLKLLQRLMGKTEKPSLHTPEELECFKRDAIENKSKHY